MRFYGSLKIRKNVQKISDCVERRVSAVQGVIERVKLLVLFEISRTYSINFANSGKAAQLIDACAVAV